MKITVLFAFLVLTVAAEKYSPENDEVDISSLNDEKIKEFADCFNYGQPCDPLASAFQKDLREAIEQLCAKCTDAQKLQIKHFLERLIVKYPKEYQVFSKNYDPDSKHLVALQSMLSKL